MQPKTATILAALALGACVETATPAACPAPEYAGLVGQPLAAVTLPDLPEIRVITPDSAVTLDYLPTRMNVQVGRDGRIERVYCG